jgi:hypothetical protein
MSQISHSNCVVVESNDSMILSLPVSLFSMIGSNEQFTITLPSGEIIKITREKILHKTQIESPVASPVASSIASSNEINENVD